MMTTAKEWIGLKIRCDELKERVAQGSYGDADLKVLQSILISLNSIHGVGASRIAGYEHVSKSVIGNIIGGGHPKIHNFLGAITSVNIVIDEELQNMGILKNISFDVRDNVSWIDISRITDKGKIHLLTSVFEDLIDGVRSVNNFDEIMSNSEKEDVIKILEAAICHIRGGLVDVGFIRAVGSRLRSVAIKVSGKLGDASIEEVARRGIDVISDIFL